MGIHVNKKAASTRKMVRIPVIKKSTSFGCNTSLCVYIDVIRLYSSSSKRLFTCPIVKVIYSLVYTYKLNYLFPISILFKYVHVLYCTLVCVCLSVYSCHDDNRHTHSEKRAGETLIACGNLFGSQYIRTNTQHT